MQTPEELLKEVESLRKIYGDVILTVFADTTVMIQQELGRELNEKEKMVIYAVVGSCIQTGYKLKAGEK
jgi:hypothetical protein